MLKTLLRCTSFQIAILFIHIKTHPSFSSDVSFSVSVSDSPSHPLSPLPSHRGCDC